MDRTCSEINLSSQKIKNILGLELGPGLPNGGPALFKLRVKSQESRACPQSCAEGLGATAETQFHDLIPDELL